MKLKKKNLKKNKIKMNLKQKLKKKNLKKNNNKTNKKKKLKKKNLMKIKTNQIQLNNLK